jgi:DNA-binding MarR family transcriptional regulator
MTKRSTRKSVAELMGKRLSTATIMFHSAVADQMGISVTDAKCRSILLQFGSMTAGELAQRLGLTTGAVTGVIDRLERARLVRRAADPKDRRRVVVEAASNPMSQSAIERLFEPMKRRIVALTSLYSAHDQATIVGFLIQAAEILEQETVRLRAR